MTRDQIAAELRLVEFRVLQGEWQIADQQAVIADFEAAGRRTTGARELLQTFQVMKRIRVADRGLLWEQPRLAE